MSTQNVTITPCEGVATIDAKRVHLPIVLTSTCPKCGGVVMENLDSLYYLAYPKINQPFKHTFYHECEGSPEWYDHEWQVDLILRVSLEVAP